MLILVNIFAWGFLHFFISYLCFLIPIDFFKKDLSGFRIAGWEKDGALWNNIFHVKKWKKHLIDGSSIVKQSYNKSNLHGTKKYALAEFAAETKRAELTHWLLIPPALLFFLWNPMWAGWVMVAYALIANLPFIITQRYNRARIEKIIMRL
ncbi:glycosyl-4,4'-diaponeurosporenoate acyltransferase CrtO family protein [Oceanobacillus sp. CAU 1775]